MVNCLVEMGVAIIRRRHLAALLVSVGFVVFYLVAWAWSEMLVVSTDILFVLVSAVCAALSFLVVKERRTTGRSGKVHLGLFLGMSLWFLGEAIWAVYEVGFRVSVPYPSIADVFYLAAYVPIAAGIIQFLWAFEDMVNRSSVLIASFSGAVVIGLTSFFLFGPLYSSSRDPWTKFFDLAYPILDVVILILCLFVALVLIYKGRVVAGSWRWISLGLGLNVVADILFSYGTLAGWYYSGHPIELVWLWSYICLGVGFQTQRHEL